MHSNNMTVYWSKSRETNAHRVREKFNTYAQTHAMLRCDHHSRCPVGNVYVHFAAIELNRVKNAPHPMQCNNMCYFYATIFIDMWWYSTWTVLQWLLNGAFQATMDFLVLNARNGFCVIEPIRFQHTYSQSFPHFNVYVMRHSPA